MRKQRRGRSDTKSSVDEASDCRAQQKMITPALFRPTFTHYRLSETAIGFFAPYMPPALLLVLFLYQRVV